MGTSRLINSIEIRYSQRDFVPVMKTMLCESLNLPFVDLGEWCLGDADYLWLISFSLSIISRHLSETFRFSFPNTRNLATKWIASSPHAMKSTCLGNSPARMQRTPPLQCIPSLNAVTFFPPGTLLAESCQQNYNRLRNLVLHKMASEYIFCQC